MGTGILLAVYLVERSRLEVWYSPPTSTGVKDERRYPFTSLMHLHGTDSVIFTPYTECVLSVPLKRPVALENCLSDQLQLKVDVTGKD
jgi:hypothetical protein